MLLHGFGSWHGAWTGVSRNVPGRVIAYDLPGHAGSLAHPGAGSAGRTARAIFDDLHRRNVARAHLAGHSLGGAVALLMAAQAPHSIGSLVLLAPGGIGEEIDAPLLRRYGAAVSKEELRAALKRMIGAQSPINERLLRGLAAVRNHPGQHEALVTIARTITRGERQGTIPAEILSGLRMPVAVAWGDADPLLPVEQARRLPPHFELRVLPGAGHMLIEEAHADVAKLIQSTRRKSAAA